ncbi:MAG: MBOAT family protein [Bacteroidota bacterium]
MLFSSLTFLYLFLPLTLIVNWLLRKTEWRNVFLLFASLGFYAWGEGVIVLVMIGSILINFLIGMGISQPGQSQGSKTARLYLALGVAVNLLLLAIFKYANFIVDNLNNFLTGMGGSSIDLAPIHLPIGISFFTFQAISYLVDVYYKPEIVQKNPLRVGLYISLFPQLIAGPIVRYGDIFKQISSRIVEIELFASGVKRFITGLVKKVLLADTVGRVTDAIFDIPTSQLDLGTAWLGILCYTLQIYLDFSAYSDMAIGIGRMLGFRFLENFNYPYIAKSIREFWRRWHISLSTWFRDYLYVPLGGNRKGFFRTYFNLLLVFFLCGLWHGASWSFVFWGLFHGLFLVLERIGLGKFLERIPGIFQYIYVLIVVMVGWVFFRAENFDYALGYLGAMIGIAETPLYYANYFLDKEVILALFAGILFSTPIYPFVERKLTSDSKSSKAYWFRITEYSLLLWLLVLSGMYLASHGYNPFIYFRF